MTYFFSYPELAFIVSFFTHLIYSAGMKISPFATPFPEMPAIDGVKFASYKCGVKYSDKLDLLLVEFVENTQVAGVYTKSKTAAPCIYWNKKALQNGTARGLVVNSGNANAFTGEHGKQAVQAITAKTADLLGCDATQIFNSSTGVIGEKLPYEKIVDALPKLSENLNAEDIENAAEAITTTDTFTKGLSTTAEIGGVEVKINGIAKGSGMIAPNMATMLAYVFTDAAIPSDTLQKLLSEGCEKSFNSITVDSDTSTSDALMLFATGKAGNNNDDLTDFKAKLEELLIGLAQLIVKDGEGVSKFITIKVEGAVDNASAKKIALTIGNSPLVKTAIAGEDANWGRIVAAVGKAEEQVEQEKLSIWIGDLQPAKNGELNPDYSEEPAEQYMKNDNINITVDVGLGDGTATIWTTDLTHEYISINADYRS